MAPHTPGIRAHRGKHRAVRLSESFAAQSDDACSRCDPRQARDDLPELGFGLMYHGLTYADEAYSDDTRMHMTANFWYSVMRRGVIEFPSM